MGQPVKVSAKLLLAARVTGQLLNRSIAGQIEYWASLGRALDPLIHGDAAAALCRSGKARPLSATLESVDSHKGRARVSDYLAEQPYPHFEADPGNPNLLIRIEANGRRTRGRFVNRKFQVVKAKRK